MQSQQSTGVSINSNALNNNNLNASRSSNNNGHVASDARLNRNNNALLATMRDAQQVDQLARLAFPAAFGLFIVFYWPCYALAT